MFSIQQIDVYQGKGLEHSEVTSCRFGVTWPNVTNGFNGEMNHVFVSHESSDERTTKAVCDALDAEGICVWVSFRNIAGGEHWDESIETALEKASAVVVIVSPKSVTSRYVRAEVEGAIRLQKTVIPVIIAPSKLPIRWETLHYVKWNLKKPALGARQVARGLPQATATALRDALNDRSRFGDVRDMILAHTEWLPIEYHMANIYTYKTKTLVWKESLVDIFAARLDTVGPRAYLYYLGSPYHRPISVSGNPNLRLQQMLDAVRCDSAVLRNDMHRTHRLAPGRLFHSELSDWKKVFPHYNSIKANLIVGRRVHYDDKAEAGRAAIVSEINRELFPREAYLGSGVEIMSYDRILESIGGQSGIARNDNQL